MHSDLSKNATSFLVLPRIYFLILMHTGANFKADKNIPLRCSGENPLRLVP